MEVTGKVVACGVLLFAASLNAAAADQGFYFGAIGGRADYEFERSRFPFVSGVVPVAVPSLRDLPILPFPTGGVFTTAVSFAPFQPQWQPDDDHESSAFGILAGYRIMRYAAVELNYLDLGKLRETDTLVIGSVPNPTRLNFKRSLETTGPSVSALGILPILEPWTVYARAGVLFANMKLTNSLDGNSSSSITFGSDSFLWGVGTQFDWGAHWSVRADFQRFNSVGEKNGAGRADIDLLTLGVIFRL